ncbi:MAG: hypothetical protein PHR16_16210 [Methylovulum sp.]|nr:hypothetical protein [Methylovulum sp.]
MSVDIQEGNLLFSFKFDAIKFDDSQYYREHFIKIQNGISAVDILAVDGNIGYLIEVKDYTHPDSEELKLNDLIDAIVKKIISTLSAILPMKMNAHHQTEKDLASLFCKTNEVKIFLHLELPPPTSKLQQSTWSFQNIQMKLKNKLKPIDAHPKVVAKKCPNRFPWTVSP